MEKKVGGVVSDEDGGDDSGVGGSGEGMHLVWDEAWHWDLGLEGAIVVSL